MSWDVVGKSVNSNFKTPLNHLIWLNDYKTYGQDSYVYNNKNILHELYRSPIAMNDKYITEEALTYIVNSNEGIGLALSYIYGVGSSELSSYSSLEELVTSSEAVQIILTSELLYNSVIDDDTRVGKFVATIAGLDASQYENMTELVSSSEAMEAVIASDEAMKAVADSSVAMKAVADSSVVMKAVADSSVAMEIVAASSVAMEEIAASSVAFGAIVSSSAARDVVLASQTALTALDASPLAKTLSSNGTITGKGFVISYSVASWVVAYCRGGYTVTIDSKVIATCKETTGVLGDLPNITASGKHIFFDSNIALAFTSISTSGYTATGGGNMKYILAS